MDEVKLKLDENGEGTFYIIDGTDQLGEIIIAIKGNDLTAYHTEVLPEAEGKGLAKKLVTAMAEYARRNNLKVIPLCTFVHLQFRHHPDEYADVWNKEEGKV